MKIFFACHRFPFPPNRGGKIRPFNMIKHLSRRHEVFVASLAHTKQELEQGAGLKEHCAEIYAAVLPERLRWLQAFSALPTAEPSSVAYFRSSGLVEKVKRAGRRISFDAVIVHCAFAAQYGLRVPARFRLIDFGDLDSGKWLDYAEQRCFPLSLGYRLEGLKLRRYERRVAAAFDYCTLTTQGELAEFEKLAVDRPRRVIPNGVDESYFCPNGGPNPTQPVIVFLGRMDYHPNIDGVLYFVRNVLPKIRATIPDVEFRIIGSNPAPAIERLRQLPGVMVTGHVPDVRPLLREATVSVAPLRIARGTQNKILESMAMGVPVVATTQAAKGIDAIPGRHILIADSPDAFAEQVMSVSKNQQRRGELASAGRDRVKERHSWTLTVAHLDSILSSAIEHRSLYPR